MKSTKKHHDPETTAPLKPNWIIQSHLTSTKNAPFPRGFPMFRKQRNHDLGFFCAFAFRLVHLCSLPGLRHLSLGGLHSVVIDAAGKAYSFGDNRRGQRAANGRGLGLLRLGNSPVGCLFFQFFGELVIGLWICYFWFGFVIVVSGGWGLASSHWNHSCTT